MINKLHSTGDPALCGHTAGLVNVRALLRYLQLVGWATRLAVHCFYQFVRAFVVKDTYLLLL
jgi:hypothetical protein